MPKPISDPEDVPYSTSAFTISAPRLAARATSNKKGKIHERTKKQQRNVKTKEYASQHVAYVAVRN